MTPRIEVYYLNDKETDEAGWYYAIYTHNIGDIGPYNSSEIAWSEAKLEAADL